MDFEEIAERDDKISRLINIILDADRKWVVVESGTRTIYFMARKGVEEKISVLVQAIQLVHNLKYIPVKYTIQQGE